ncbi:hypothetical protein NBRC111894_303 [Sporolactobacillus inulinus]|uniref:Uncharacterized protein n=1 Tax=Sporolactobacillus inulinus TaxID=2078 RepID=A0A4Y1Z6Y0_9BACL|nr:hypothetical protein NBRC111894_303 [Sporolactobacillus inulinus]
MRVAGFWPCTIDTFLDLITSQFISSFLFLFLKFSKGTKSSHSN